MQNRADLSPMCTRPLATSDSFQLSLDKGRGSPICGCMRSCQVAQDQAEMQRQSLQMIRLLVSGEIPTLNAVLEEARQSAVQWSRGK